MKYLTVFYSLEGNCKLIADEISANIDTDILRLFPDKDVKPTGFFRYMWGGRQVMLDIQPDLQPYDINPGDYDVILLGTPVWAFSYAPAINTFLTKTELCGKKIALFVCSGGGKGKVFSNLHKRLSNNTIIGEIDFIEPLKKDTAEVSAKVKEWISRLKSILNE